MTEKKPNLKGTFILHCPSCDSAADGVCWGGESWSWHVISLLEKSRLSSYFAQTRLLHLMCMGSKHSG